MPVKTAEPAVEPWASDFLLRPTSVELDEAGKELRWSIEPARPPEGQGRAYRAALRRASRVDAARSLSRSRPERPHPELLAQFMRLRTAGPKAIRLFAERYGVLGLCRHHKPSSHHPSCARIGLNTSGRFSGAESVQVWREFAQRAFAAYETSRRLRDPDYRWNDEAVRLVAVELSRVPMLARRSPRMALWQAVVDIVNQWVVLGDVRPRLLYSSASGEQPDMVYASGWKDGPDAGIGDRPRVGLDPGPDFPLFGILAVQLMRAVYSEKGVGPTACRECSGTLKAADVKYGRERYCRACRTARNAAAARGFRKRDGKDKKEALMRFRAQHLPNGSQPPDGLLALWNRQCAPARGKRGRPRNEDKRTDLHPANWRYTDEAKLLLALERTGN